MLSGLPSAGPVRQHPTWRRHLQDEDHTISGAEDLITISDPRDLDGSSRVSRLLPNDLGNLRYGLRDPSLALTGVDVPLTVHSRVNAGDLHLTRVFDGFEVEMEVAGDGLPRYWFCLVHGGTLQMSQGDQTVIASGAVGSALRGRPGTVALSSARSLRTSLWIEDVALEQMLERMLDDTLKNHISFQPAVDWSRGLAASLVGLMGFLAADAGLPDGLSSNPVAFASFNDTVLRTIALGLAHDRSENLTKLASAASTHPVRRAEEFMRANAERPLRMAEVAAAAGCSLRALEASYERIHGMPPVSALRQIRLDKARDALRRGEAEPVIAVARRYGFTNAGRFAKAYRARFGEFPSETAGEALTRSLGIAARRVG